MTISNRIHKGRHRVSTRADGINTIDDIKHNLRALKRHPDFNLDFDHLLNLSGGKTAGPRTP